MKEKKPKSIIKKPILKPEDIEIWERATEGVINLKNSNHISPENPSPKKYQRKRETSGQISLETIEPRISVNHPSSFQMDGALRKKFESGDLEIDGIIDLHGMTLAEAHHQFKKFLTQKIRKGARFLLVITGKGNGQEKGVIRQSLPQWCDDEHIKHHILSIKRAKPKHGGDGASYILLRRYRES